MPTLGSTSGTYGYGRSPQIPPPIGFTYYSPSQDPTLPTPVHYFEQLGSFVLDAEQSGKAFVITPTASFYVYVKIWGAGGGSGNSNISTFHIGTDNNGNPITLNGSYWGYVSSGTAVVPTWTNAQSTPYKDVGANTGGAGGFVTGRILLQSGIPYTIFAGSAGENAFARRSGVTTSPNSTKPAAGGGGAASGILVGNVFSSGSTLTQLAIAGGGGGSGKKVPTEFYLPGAGGGTNGGIATNRVSNVYSGTTNGGVVGNKGRSGLPVNQYNGGAAGAASTIGGGGGGEKGGGNGGGGSGFTATSEGIDLKTITGTYGIVPYYDDSGRSTVGDPDNSGQIVLYLNEYTASSITATGGTVTTVPIPGYELAYKYHTFTNPIGTFQVTAATANSNFVDVFVVGGGGGGAIGRLVSDKKNPPPVAYWKEEYVSQSGGGGGGVAFKSKLPISAGTYNVRVGKGGKSKKFILDKNPIGDQRASSGEPSAFFSNSLSLSKFGFPDNYFMLIHSFGATIKYINLAGLDTDGLTAENGYTSFSSALSKNLFFEEMIVFVVLPGTYDEEVSITKVSTIIGPEGTVAGKPPTPIHDHNQPRIFVCAPGKVTIKWAPLPASKATESAASPMCQLMHPASAVYGAIFDRAGYTKDSVVSASRLQDLAFFGQTTTGFSIKYAGGIGNAFIAAPRGKLVNCVLRDMTGDWGLYGVDNLANMQLSLQYCTIVTKNNDIALTGSGIPRDDKSTEGYGEYMFLRRCVLTKSMVFSKPVTAPVNNYLENAVLSTTPKFGAPTTAAWSPTPVEFGVYFGPYAWVSATTAMEKGTTQVAIVGQGGGPGTVRVFESFNAGLDPNHIDQLAGGYGSGGGSVDVITISGNVILSRNPSTQRNIQANVDYSCFGNPGGVLTMGTLTGSLLENNAGGGGAGYPGVGIMGGIGIEFPSNSGAYYGSGGSVKHEWQMYEQAAVNINGNTIDLKDYDYDVSIARLAINKAGTGGGTALGHDLSSSDVSDGQVGTVIVRYIVPGPYTPLVPVTVDKSIIAYGGTFTTTMEGTMEGDPPYREHIFLNSGTFEIAQAPEGAYIDVLLVGGGSGGQSAGVFYESSVSGGSGGRVEYQRYYFTDTIARSFLVQIGNGGGGASTPTNSRGLNSGGAGGLSQIVDINAIGPGVGGIRTGLVTDGLFSDNKTIYAGIGGNIAITQSGIGTVTTTINQGINGGGAVTYNGNYESRSLYLGGGGINNTGGGGGCGRGGSGGAGGKGIVIIRYSFSTDVFQRYV